jgi:hypothetical protein
MVVPAPICLFAYNRLIELQATVHALQNNSLAAESDLFVFIDAPESTAQGDFHLAIEDFSRSIDGFRSVAVTAASAHRGLAASVIHGATSTLEKHGNVIVVEDDLITSPNFLDFMNAALDFYAYNPNVFSISGYAPFLPSLDNLQDDVFAGYRASSWGWGTWLHQWREVDWSVSDYSTFRWSLRRNLRLMRGGSDMPLMLRRQMAGAIDSWAIRWCYAQSRLDRVTVFPRVSKVKNIGIGPSATHTVSFTDSDTRLDSSGQRNFVFPAAPSVDPVLAREFRANHSLGSRLARRFGF